MRRENTKAKVIDINQLIGRNSARNSQAFKEKYQYKLGQIVQEAIHDPLNTTNETVQQEFVLAAVLAIIDQGKTNKLMAGIIETFGNIDFGMDVIEQECLDRLVNSKTGRKDRD